MHKQLSFLPQVADVIDWAAIERQLEHCTGLRTLEITAGSSSSRAVATFLALPDIQTCILNHFSAHFRPFIHFL